jgi:hypothetical protein
VGAERRQSDFALASYKEKVQTAMMELEGPTKPAQRRLLVL